jgi:hypothetical protein
VAVEAAVKVPPPPPQAAAAAEEAEVVALEEGLPFSALRLYRGWVRSLLPEEMAPQEEAEMVPRQTVATVAEEAEDKEALSCWQP